MQRKKNLVGNQLRVLIFLLVSECILLLLRPLIRRVAANKLNKQSRTADEGCYSSLGFGRDANNPSL